MVKPSKTAGAGSRHWTSMPEFTADPVQRLRHTLAVFEEDQVEPGDWAIRASTGWVPGHDVTGVTWQDLRAILAMFEQSS